MGWAVSFFLSFIADSLYSTDRCNLFAIRNYEMTVDGARMIASEARKCSFDGNYTCATFYDALASQFGGLFQRKTARGTYLVQDIFSQSRFQTFPDDPYMSQLVPFCPSTLKGLDGMRSINISYGEK